jgi:hypothetical protein
MKKVVLAVCGVLATGSAVTLVHVRRSEAQARKLIQALASLEVGTSTTADVRRVQEQFDRYQVSSGQADENVRFVITNQPLATLRVQPIAILSAGIVARNGKVVSVEVSLERQPRSGLRAAMVFESLQNLGFCEQPYCVGNPIGKPFIVTRLDAHATLEQKRRAFDLNLGWLTRFKGEPRVCDLSPHAWEDWKTQRPDLVAQLQATYKCRWMARNMKHLYGTHNLTQRARNSAQLC